MNDLTPVLNQIFAECRDDYVGLWSIIKTLRHYKVEESAIMDMTIDLISRLHREGKIVAGTFDTNKFNEWEGSTNDIAGRIRYEWQKLGKEPSLGDIAWFTERRDL